MVITPKAIEQAAHDLMHCGQLPLRQDSKVDFNMLDLILRRTPDSALRVKALELLAWHGMAGRKEKT